MCLVANSSLSSRLQTIGPSQESRNGTRTPTRKWVQPAVPRRRSPAPEYASENRSNPVFEHETSEPAHVLISVPGETEKIKTEDFF